MTIGYTDLQAQRETDERRVAEMLDDGPTTWQVASRLGVMESYAEQLLVGLERVGLASRVCGIWTRPW